LSVLKNDIGIHVKNKKTEVQLNLCKLNPPYRPDVKDVRVIVLRTHKWCINENFDVIYVPTHLFIYRVWEITYKVCISGMQTIPIRDSILALLGHHWRQTRNRPRL